MKLFIFASTSVNPQISITGIDFQTYLDSFVSYVLTAVIAFFVFVLIIYMVFLVVQYIMYNRNHPKTIKSRTEIKIPTQTVEHLA